MTDTTYGHALALSYVPLDLGKSEYQVQHHWNIMHPRIGKELGSMTTGARLTGLRYSCAIIFTGNMPDVTRSWGWRCSQCHRSVAGFEFKI